MAEKQKQQQQNKLKNKNKEANRERNNKVLYKLFTVHVTQTANLYLK